MLPSQLERFPVPLQTSCEALQIKYQTPNRLKVYLKVYLEGKLKMSLCSHHLRIGILVDKDFIKVKNGVLSGPLGELYNQFLFSKNQLSRNCTLRFIPTTAGRSIASNSTGFYSYRNRVVDLFLKQSKLGSGNLYVEETQVIGYTT